MARPEAFSLRNAVDIFTRPAGHLLSEILLPYRILQDYGGLERAKLFMEEGWGLVIAINHFGKGDPFEIVGNLVFGDRFMRTRPILGPVAYHQYGKAARTVSVIFDVRLCPVVTTDSVNEGKTGGHQQGWGLKEYVDNAMDVLQNGGVVLIAPQAGRREKLGEPTEPTMSYFILQSNRNNVDNIVFVPIGLGLRSVTDYRKDFIGGFNIWRTYEIRIGNAFTKAEVVASAKANKMKLDQWFFSQLAQLVPQHYL